MNSAKDHVDTAKDWADSLARSRAQIEAGETIPLEPVLDRLRASAARSVVFWASELPEELVQALGAARMDPRHQHLNALMDDEPPCDGPVVSDDPDYPNAPKSDR